MAKQEVTLIDLAHVFWKSKKALYLIVGLAFTIGLLISYTTPAEWKTQASLVPENNGGSGNSNSGLSGLSGLAGISISGGTSETVNPSLYPNIGSSTPFLLAVSKYQITLPVTNEMILVEEYLRIHQKRSLWKRIISQPSLLLSYLSGREKIKSDNDVSVINTKVSSDMRAILNNLKERIQISFDKKQNIVFVEVKMQDAAISASVAQFTIDYIADFVADYSTSRDSRKLAFIESQLKMKKDTFQLIQAKLAKFKDRNVILSNNAGKGELVNLESDYNLAFSLYSSLQRQREEAQIKVQENSMVFLTLEPVIVPTVRFSPQKSQIMTSAILLGLFFSTLYIFGRAYILDFKKSFES